MQVCFMDVCEKGREEITELLLSRSGMTGRAQEEEVLIIPAKLYVNSRENAVIPMLNPKQHIHL